MVEGDYDYMEEMLKAGFTVMSREEQEGEAKMLEEYREIS